MKLGRRTEVEALLLVLAVVLVLCLAAWRMVTRWDPPYQGIHVRGAGRHRHRDWEGEEAA